MEVKTLLLETELDIIKSVLEKKAEYVRLFVLKAGTYIECDVSS